MGGWDGIPEDGPTTRASLEEDAPTTLAAPEQALREDAPTTLAAPQEDGPTDQSSPEEDAPTNLASPSERGPPTNNASSGDFPKKLIETRSAFDEALTVRSPPSKALDEPRKFEDDASTEFAPNDPREPIPEAPPPPQGNNLVMYIGVILGGGVVGGLLAGLLVLVIALVGVALWVLAPAEGEVEVPTEVVVAAPEPAPEPDSELVDDTDASRFVQLDPRFGSADPVERVAALSALADGEHHDEALAWYLEHDEDANVRSTAFQELVRKANTGRGQPEIQARALTAVLTDRVEQNQRKAARAYAMVGTDLAPLEHVIQKGTPTARSEVVRAIVAVASRTGKGDEARALLEANAEHLTSRSQRHAFDKALEQLSAAKGDADAE